MKQIIILLLLAYHFHYANSEQYDTIIAGLKSVKTIVKTVKNITDAIIDAFHLSSSSPPNEELSNLKLDVLSQQIETLDEEIKMSLADVVRPTLLGLKQNSDSSKTSRTKLMRDSREF